MNTQPTPETDAEEIIITKGKPTHWVSQEFARRLERERDEWEAKYIQQNKDLGCEMMDPNGTIWDYAKKVQTEITTVTAQRDRLAEALRDMLSGWRYIRKVHGDLYGVGWDRAQTKADEALQSLTQKS
jgi:hypothetical protein